MTNQFTVGDIIKLTGPKYFNLEHETGKITDILDSEPTKYEVTMSYGVVLKVYEHDLKQVLGSFEVVYNNRHEKIKLLYEQRRRKDGSSFNVFRLLHKKRQLTLRDHDLFNEKYYKFIKYFDYVVCIEIETAIKQLRFN